VASLYDELAPLYFLTSRYADALTANERARDAAMAVGDERLVVRAEVQVAVTLTTLGRPGAAGAAARQLIPRAQAAESSMTAGDFAQSRAYRDRKLEVAARMGMRSMAAFTVSNLAQLTLYMGEWQAARRYAEEALRRSRAAGSLARTSYPLSFLSELALLRGEWEEAARWLEECLGVAEPAADLQVMRYAQRLLVERDIRAGRPAAAVERLEPLLDRLPLEEHDVTALLPTLAWAHLAHGDLDGAATLATAGLRRALKQENRLALLDALRVAGMVVARQERRGEADGLFKEAVRLARAMPYPHAEARTLAEQGRMWRASDNSPRSARGQHSRRAQRTAQERLERAAAIFRRLGTTRDMAGDGRGDGQDLQRA
jgi:tetratricopeptide (TPR) repeat protein